MACGETGRVPTQLHHRRRAITLAVGGLYAAVAALTEPLTAAATFAWTVPAVVALFATLLRRAPAEPTVRTRRLRRTTLAWGAVAAVAAALELTAWLRQPAYNVASLDHPTVSVLLDPILEPWPVRFAAWCAWLWVGWRLLRS
jgi:hypothetical protein